jgi:hypothetical protein
MPSPDTLPPFVNRFDALGDAARAPETNVQSALGELARNGQTLDALMPAIGMDLRSAPMMSFARFNGATRRCRSRTH